MTISNNEINKFYNGIISDYLNNGYVVSPLLVGRWNRGISNRCANSFELVNPKIKDRVVRVFVDEDDELAYVGSTREYVRFVHIYIKQYNYTKADNKSNKTLWYDCGDLLLSKKYYHIPDSNIYTETLDEVSNVYTIRKNRADQKRELKQKNNAIKWIKLSDLKPETIDSIMVRINRMHGFKSATSSCIQKICLRKISSYNYNLRRDVSRVESIIYVDYKTKQTTIYLH